MNTWKKWTICCLIIAMLAIFPHAYATENSQLGAENPSSEVTTPKLTEADKTSMVLAALLGVSLSVNVLAAIYIFKKVRDEKTRQIDDVPLVEYDIDDDIL